MTNKELEMYQNDFKRVQKLTPIDLQDACLDEYALKHPKTKKFLGPCLVDEGDNGLGHGKKGHRKAYLAFNFNKTGKLMDITVHVPSIKETFTFVQNATDEYE